MKIKMFIVLIALAVMPSAYAATVSVSQTGADPGTIMKGQYFTITVSGLSGTGTAALVDLPSGISVDEGTTKSFSSGTSSVSWTTAIATQSLSSQKIYSTITVAGSPSSAESSPFDIVLPPSLSATIGHGSVYGVGGAFQDPTVGSTHTITINVQNYGETDASDVVATISNDAGFSVDGSSSQSIGTISGGAGGSGGSASVSWTVTADSPADGAIYVTTTSSNGGSITQSIPVEVTEGGGVSPGGGGGAPPADVTKTATVEDGKATAIFSSVSSGKTGTVTIPDTADIPFKEIAIKVLNRVTNVQIAIYKLSEKPSDIVEDIKGLTHSYIQIDETNIQAADIDTVTIKFKVPLSWINDNKIDKATVVLNRYADGKWNELTTTKDSEDSSYVHYSATSPGLSVFGISGQVVSAPETTAPPVTTVAPTTTAPPTAPPTTAPPVEKPKSPVGKIILTILIIAIIAGAAYYFYQKKSGEEGEIEAPEEVQEPAEEPAVEEPEEEPKE